MTDMFPILCSVLLSILALPPFDIYGIGFIALIPLLHVVYRGQVHGFLSGFIYAFLISNYAFLGAKSYSIVLWLSTLLCFTLSFSLLMWIIQRFSRTAWYFIAVPCLFVLFEWFLQYIGLPMSWLLYVTSDLQFIRIASMIGPFATSFVFISISAGLTHAFNNKKKTGLVYALIWLVTSYTFGATQQGSSSAGETLRVAVVQSNIPPYIYNHPERDGHLYLLQKKLHSIVDELTHYTTQPALVLWPEISFQPFMYRHDKPYDLQFNSIMPMSDITPQGKVSNAVFSITEAQRVVAKKDKQRFIPFVEKGLNSKVIVKQPLGLYQSLNLICLESSFPAQAYRGFDPSTQLITISSSDAYAGPSLIADLHAEFARIWAVTYQKPVLRSANGGISVIYDQNGEKITQKQIYTEGIITADITINEGLSYYATYGTTINLCLLILVLIILFIALRRKSSIYQPTHIFTILLVLSLVMPLVLAEKLYFQNKFGIRNPALSYQDPLQNNPHRYKNLQIHHVDQSIIAALAYLLRKYGHDETIMGITQQLKQRHQKGNIDYFQLINYYGFQAKRSNAKQIKQVYTPAIVILSYKGAVVLERIDKQSATFYSPLKGKLITVQSSAFMKRWNGQSFWLAGKTKEWDSED